MKPLKPLAKAIPNVIKMLNKNFGVDVSIYPPKKDVKKTIGIKNDNIEFEEESIYDGLLLAPFVLDKRIESFSGIIDPYSTDENIAYTSVNDKFPIYSKIIMVNMNGVSSYIIDDIRTISDNEITFYYEYILIPHTISVSDTDELDMTEDILSIEEDLVEDEIISEDSDTVIDITAEKEFTYKPIT